MTDAWKYKRSACLSVRKDLTATTKICMYNNFAYLWGKFLQERKRFYCPWHEYCLVFILFMMFGWQVTIKLLPVWTQWWFRECSDREQQQQWQTSVSNSWTVYQYNVHGLWWYHKRQRETRHESTGFCSNLWSWVGEFDESPHKKTYTHAQRYDNHRGQYQP